MPPLAGHGTEPLFEVSFLVVDVETTGMSPQCSAITEVGAVKLRGGERVASLSTLVNPGRAIPPWISVLTGITESMVAPAPPIEAVLPSLLELARGAVLVGHNVPFDLRFLNTALERSGRDRLGQPALDTLRLARQVVGDEVPNCKLATLAAHLRLERRPSHRALDDAVATGDLLHHLLERVGTSGVLTLGQLLEPLHYARSRWSTPSSWSMPSRTESRS